MVYRSLANVGEMLNEEYRPDEEYFKTVQSSGGGCRDYETFCLYPGDVMFFPSGLWHKVESVRTYEKPVKEQMQQIIDRNDAFKDQVVKDMEKMFEEL